MKGSVLYFVQLVLRMLLNLGPDIDYKRGKFSQTLLKKVFEFILSEKSAIVALNLGLMLLLTEVDLISGKQSYKRDALIVRDTDRVKIIFALPTKVAILFMQISII